MTTTDHSPAVQLILEGRAQPPPAVPLPFTAARQALDLIGRLTDVAKCVVAGHKFQDDEVAFVEDALNSLEFAKARNWRLRYVTSLRDIEPLTDEDVTTLEGLGL